MPNPEYPDLSRVDSGPFVSDIARTDMGPGTPDIARTVDPVDLPESLRSKFPTRQGSVGTTFEVSAGLPAQASLSAQAPTPQMQMSPELLTMLTQQLQSQPASQIEQQLQSAQPAAALAQLIAQLQSQPASQIQQFEPGPGPDSVESDEESGEHVVRQLEVAGHAHGNGKAYVETQIPYREARLTSVTAKGATIEAVVVNGEHFLFRSKPGESVTKINESTTPMLASVTLERGDNVGVMVGGQRGSVDVVLFVPHE